nr:NUDIX hydrolase [Falsochrobactrum ovis]
MTQSEPSTRRPVLRPRDAASLLLIDRDGPSLRVLMGRRHHSLAFMPGKYVFPGGRTDPADKNIISASELPAQDIKKLLAGMGSKASVGRARALGLSAIRETFEETGLRVARTTSKNIILPNHEDWCSFLREGMLPALGDLRYFARAITPPGHIRRFDTRFFIAFRDQVPDLETQKIVPSGELEDLNWVTMDELKRLDLARITQAIFREAKALLSDYKAELPATIPVIEFTMRHRHYVREVI